MLPLPSPRRNSNRTGIETGMPTYSLLTFASLGKVPGIDMAPSKASLAKVKSDNRYRYDLLACRTDLLLAKKSC